MRHASGDQLKCSQPKQFHSRETIIISEFSILINSTRIGHVAATWGRVRCGRARSTEWLRCQRGAHIADDDIRPPRLQSYLPASQNPGNTDQRDDRRNPMEIPISVNPVLTRRRIRPRATTVRKLMSARWRTVDESAVLHRKGFRGAPSDPHVVGDEYDGHLLLCVDSHDEVENEPSAGAVEVTGGFIGKEHRRTVRQASRYGDALPFASGQFRGKMVEPMFQANRLQKFKSASRSLRSPAVRFEHRYLHVFERCEGGQQMESLKDKADFMSAIGARSGRSSIEFPRIAQCPGGGPIEPAQQLKQSRLSAPAGTGDGDEVTPNGSSLAQRLHLPIVEILLQIYRLEDERLGGLSNGR